MIVDRLTGLRTAELYDDQLSTAKSTATENPRSGQIDNLNGFGDRAILLQYLKGIGGGEAVGGHVAEVLAISGGTFVKAFVYEVDTARSVQASETLARSILPVR